MFDATPLASSRERRVASDIAKLPELSTQTHRLKTTTPIWLRQEGDEVLGITNVEDVRKARH